MNKIIFIVKLIFVGFVITGLNYMFSYIDILQNKYAISQMSNGNISFLVELLSRIKGYDLIIYILVAFIVFANDIVKYFIKGDK